jgi:nucleotide-binding universal stress UspA family protein
MKVHFQHILCATDLSDRSNSAVVQAIQMAKEFGSTLSICHVIDMPLITMHGAAFVYQEDQIGEMKTEALAQIQQLVADTELDWEAVVEVGPVSSTLCRLADEKKADLTIVTTHGLSGLKRLFLGSVTERLLRTMGCPLLVVNYPEAIGKRPKPFKGFGFKQILVGCDFSADSKRAVDYGLSLAQEFEAVIHLVHVMEPFVYHDTVHPETTLTETLVDFSSSCQSRLQELVPKEALNWCDVTFACEKGKPFQVLQAYAEENDVDLIVLGVRGHSLVETMLLGSTTDRVIRGACCPVLTVCPP